MRPWPLGSMLKDLHKVLANWLVRLLGSMHSSAMALAGVMSTGCGLKKLWRGLIAKAANFWLVVCIEPRRVVVGVVGQEAQ
jgi:hypothetical protein